MAETALQSHAPAEPAAALAVRPRDPGVSAILWYKVVKGAAAAALAVLLFVLLLLHATGPLEALGAGVHHHFTGAWSVALSRAILSAAEPKHLWFVTAALVMDASLTLTEAWALHHGHWWGPWLVIAATASLLPFEVVSLARRVHAGRVVVFLANVAIVAYLVWRTRKDKKQGIVRPAA